MLHLLGNRYSSFRIALMIVAIVGLILAALPAVIIVVMSFSGANTLDFPPPSFSTQWYANAIEVLKADAGSGGMSAASSFKSSLVVGAITMIVAVIVCTPLAYVMERSKNAFTKSLELLFTMPMVFPLVMLGVAFLLMVGAFENQTARLTGQAIDIGIWRLAIPHLTLALPFVLRNCLSAMNGINIEIEEAAQSLGAKPSTVFLTIILPLMKPGIMAGLIFAFVISFNEFTITYFMYTIDQRTLPIWMYSKTASSLDPTTLAISSMIIAIDLALIIWVDKLIAGKGRLF